MKNLITLLQLAKYDQFEVEIDENIPWLKSILDEFNENLSIDDYEQDERLPTISFKGYLKKCEDDKHHDYAILIGDFEMNFFTLCIQTGAVIMDQIDATVGAAFIHSSLKEKFHYEDETEIFLKDREYDLYFHEKGKIDISPVLLEHAYINKNPYPVLEL